MRLVDVAHAARAEPLRDDVRPKALAPSSAGAALKAMLATRAAIGDSRKSAADDSRLSSHSTSCCSASSPPQASRKKMTRCPAGCPNVAWKIDSIRSQRSEPMELGAFYRFGGDFGG